jgi:hypothetical protein
MRMYVALPIIAALAAAAIGSSSQAFGKPGGAGTRSEPTRVVRDHRAPPVVRDHRAPPVVRDHRAPPVVRDHRAPSPKVIDHRRRGGVVVTSGAPRK